MVTRTVAISLGLEIETRIPVERVEQRRKFLGGARTVHDQPAVSEPAHHVEVDHRKSAGQWIDRLLHVVRRAQKAQLLYGAIDGSSFYKPAAAKEFRSLTNVTWRLPSEELEKKFVKESEAAGMIGLAGHRSVGGLRASIYNACTLQAVQALVSFVKEFERRSG